VDVTTRVATALACSALDQSLAGVLLFDLDPALVYPLANWLKDLLKAGQPELGEPAAWDGPPLVPLGPQLAEDTLWERFTMERADPERTEDLGFRWRPGRLARYDQEPGIVLVPDLAELGLPAARAAITLLDADVAHLERSGVDKVWRPRDRWLAALRHVAADKVSPHLLDRFAVRVDAKGLGLPWHPDADRDLPWDPDPALAQAVKYRLGQPLPGMSDEAARRVLRIVGAGAPGARRWLALARLARALAALQGDGEALPGHVDSAAELTGQLSPGGTLRTWGGPHGQANGSNGSSDSLGSRASNGSNGSNDLGASNAPDGSNGPASASNGSNASNGSSGSSGSNGSNGPANGPRHGRAAPGPLRTAGGSGQLPVVSAGPAKGDFIPGPARTAYPEDAVPPSRDAPLLRLGWQRMLTGPPRGQPIGTQRALSGSDIAVAATILNAARFQRLRCPRHGEHYLRCGQLHLEKVDLLSHRRAPQPGHLLVLLLDHTCRAEDWDWYEPLSGYLGWAYANRALVGVVEVGTPAERPPDTVTESDLRATRFQARGVLDRRVLAAIDPLYRPPRRATPLAHALSLAGELLRRTTQQGGTAVSEAFLVVVTDARANVPLADSKAGTVPRHVGLTAFDDSLSEARKIASLDPARRRVRSVVIDPGWQANGRLAVQLAAELGAALEHGISAASSTGAEDGWPGSDGGWADA